jgi:hypothetical protein
MIAMARRRDGRTLNVDPLRKIIGYRQVDVSLTPGMPMFLQHEVYECGHTALAKHDIYGETNAVRRRCRKCREQANKAAEQPS